MSIDIGFVSEDLRSCPQARCREQRKVLAAFVELNAQSARQRCAYRLDAATVRREEVDLDEMREWHRTYGDDYRVRLDLGNMLPGLVEASILRIQEDSISFRYPYVYYYFVARYLRDHLAEDDVRHTVSSLTAQLNHAESANIVLFLCYLSKDQFIICSILGASRALFPSFDECDLDEDTRFIQALMTHVSQLVLDERCPERRRRDILVETDRLEQVAPGGSEDALPSTEEGPQPDALLQQDLQINVAFKTIQIMGQILRGFAGSIRAPTKAEIAGECYSLGLRVLKWIFESLESEQEAFVEYLVAFLRERHPTWSFEKLTGELSEILLRLPGGAAFVLVKYVADSVGLYDLALTCDDVLETLPTVSRAFIDLSVRLDQFPDYPKRRLFRLCKAVHDNLFAYDLLRHLAWYDFYIYRRPEQIRQSVCTTLGIKLLPATIHDPRAKRPRS